MANYKTGLIITGDASGGIRAIKATDDELGKLNKNFDRGSRQSKRFGSDAQRAGRQLSVIDQGATDASRGLALLRTNVAGVAAAMATAFGAGSVINQARLIADTDALAKSIGVATGQLQAWDYAAQQMGMSGGQIGDILKDITERIGEFSAEGTGEAAALFENLNLNIAEMERLAPDQQLLKIADAISTLETRGEKISYLERLGNDATRLLPLLDDNAALLREYSAEAEALGVSMSRVDIDNAVEANRAMRQLGGTMEGFTNQIVADLGPGLADAVGGLTDFIQEMGGAEVILTNVKDVAILTAAVMAGRYAASFAASTKQLIEKNAASAAAVVAEERTLQMAVRRAAAEATAEKRMLGRAIAEERATRGTDAHAAALARLNVARSRSIAAATEHTAAVNANTAATQRSTVAARAASGAYALIGGPLGAATLAATAFFMFRDSSDEVSESLVSLDQPLESVIDDFKELTAESQRAALIKWGDRQEEEADKARRALTKIREEVLNLGFEGSTGAEAREFFDEVSAGFEAVESGAQTLDGMLSGLQEQLEIPDSVMRNLRLLASEYSEGRVAADELGGRLEALNSTFNDVGAAAENTGSQVEDNAPSSEAIEKWEKYNQKLRESVAAIQDPSATGAAIRELNNLGIDDPVRRAITLMPAAQQDQLERQKELQKEAADASRQAASDAKNAAQEQARAAEQQANSLQAVQQEMDPLLADHATYVERIDVLDKALAEGTITQEAYGEAVRWSAEQYSRAATGAEDYEKQTERLIDQYDSHNRKAQQLRDAVDAINERYRAGEISGDQYTRMIGGVRDEMQELALEADPAAQEMARAWEEASNRIDETFADAFTGAFDSFDEFGDQLLDSFKRLLGELAYQATLKPVVVNFTGQMQGMMGGGQQQGAMQGGMNANSFGDTGDLLRYGKKGYDYFFGGGTSAAAGSAPVNYASGFGSQAATGSYGGWAGNASSAAANSGTGVASGAMSGVYTAGAAYAGGYVGSEAAGMFSDKQANSNYGQMAGTAIGSIWGPVGAGIGAALGSAVDVFFGSEKTPFSGRFGTTDQASSGTFEHQDGGRFHGESALGYTGFLNAGTERLQRAGTGNKDWAEELTDASVEMDNLVASIAQSPQELNAMRDAVQGLKVSSNNAGAIIDFALKKRPRAALEQLGGDFGEFVDGLGGGIEQVVQQAQAAQQAYGTVTQGLDRLNIEFGVTGPAVYSAASEIAEFSGGLERFSDRAQFYYENFISEADKQERAMDAAARSMGVFTARTGRVVTSSEQLTDLVEGLNLNTTAGRELYAAAMELAPALLEVEAGLERVRDRFSDMLSEAESALSSAEQSALSAWQTFDSQSYDQQITLLEMLGDSETALAMERERELATIDESLRPHQERIWALEDEAAAQQTATRAAQDYANEVSRVRGELDSAFGSISQWIDQLNATSQTPSLNLEAAGEQFARQLVLAENGDRDALQGITQYADQYLEAGREMFASGSGFQAIQEDVLSALENLPDQISSEEYLSQEIREALFDALEGKATDSEINALMARVVDGDLSIEAALASIYGSSEGTEGNTENLEERARDQLDSLNGLVGEMTRTTDQFLSLNSTMISLQDSIHTLGVAQEEVARIERERAKAEKAAQADLIKSRAQAMIDSGTDEQRRIESQMQNLPTETGSLQNKMQQYRQELEDGPTHSVRTVSYVSQGNGRQRVYGSKTVADNDRIKELQNLIRNASDQISERKKNQELYEKLSKQLDQAKSDYGNLAALRNEYKELMGEAAPFAKGGVFTNTIVSRPTHFDMGLMGEAGPEAIVPLHMGSDGLGIKNYADRRLPMPDMPLPEFPALGSNDVLQVLQDVKKELAASRAENKRLLEQIGDNTGNTVKAVSGTATRAEQQRVAQLKEQQAATRAAKVKGRSV